MPITKSPAKAPEQKTGELAEAGVRETYPIDLDPTRTLGLPDDPGEMSYDQLDQIVRAGSLVFAVTGRALGEIKKRELWKESHPTWASYCEERLGRSVVHANRLIKCARVMEYLKPIGFAALPSCESQARPLGQLETAEDTQKVWAELVGEAGSPPTAEQVKAAVDQFLARGGDCEDEDAEDTDIEPGGGGDAGLDATPEADAGLEGAGDDGETRTGAEVSAGQDYVEVPVANGTAQVAIPDGAPIQLKAIQKALKAIDGKWSEEPKEAVAMVARAFLVSVSALNRAAAESPSIPRGGLRFAALKLWEALG